MDVDDFPDDIQLDNEAFEQFDDYDAFADEMMEIAEKADQQQQQKQHQQQQPSSTQSLPSRASTSSVSTSATRAASSGLGALPAQRDYLAMLNAQSQQVEREVVASQQQRAAATTAAATTAWKGATKKGGGGGGWNRPIGSTSNAGAPVEGDLAAVNVAKKRVKMVRLDSEKLLGIQGFPMLMAQGKRLKIRNKHRTSAEKDANSKKNLADLMLLYQTWAHNLFPKSTFRDFILQTEAKCKSDKQIKASMNGWRDAYWDEVREKQYVIDDTERVAKEAEERMNSVWDRHSAGRTQGATESMEQDSFLDTEKGDGQPSSSNWSFGNEGTTFTTTGSNSGGSKPAQLRTRPVVASRKGKERLVDNPSAAMRLQVSDDEEESGQDDYEVALSRMRDSMNLNSRSPVVQRTTYKAQKSLSGVEARDEDRQESFSRIPTSSGVGRAGSIFDEEEEDDDEAPLFTHRALQMIGGLSALKERQKATAVETESSNNNNIPGRKTPALTQRATLSSDEEDYDNNSNTLNQADPSPVNLSLGSQWGISSGGSMFAEFEDGGDSGGVVKGENSLIQNDDEDDEEAAVIAQRRPKARKAIILEESDDE
ncbi:chromosome segregation in meiosis- protein [Linnemannia schmuckeri]|uniref:Chromosome segregation in meiosis protein n=1 Tax=Linnemannia schmuckeri TaxID=64567 RepID=A0A9P5VB50_9FUNG|nr:chromosome segregation in meiosis- protein [Linnemannia schmuckeri]